MLVIARPRRLARWPSSLSRWPSSLSRWPSSLSRWPSSLSLLGIAGIAAVVAASAHAGGPPNDECATPLLAITGANPFQTIGATTDGSAHPECDYDGQTYADVWFLWFADIDGATRVTTCNTADFDTSLVIYASPTCDPSSIVTCSADGPGCIGGGSIAIFDAVAGTPYLVRVGGQSPGETGTGVLAIEPAVDLQRIAVLGGGLPGQDVALGGVWDFDVLSPAQRAVPANCGNSVARPYGEILELHGWTPSPDGQAPVVEMLPAPIAPDIGGGVLRLIDPDLGLAPGAYAGMRSPTFLPPPTFTVDSFFDIVYRIDFGPLDAGLVMVHRLDQHLSDGTVQTEIVEMALTGSGPADVRVPFTQPLRPDATGVEAEVGVRNDGDAPAAGEGPTVDEVQGEVQAETGTKSKRNIPDITQGDDAICMAAAFADCFAYWAKNGYPELRQADGTEAEKNDKLRDDLREKIYGGADNDAEDPADDADWDLGTWKYLRDKGVAKGQTPTDPNRPQLEWKRYHHPKITWDKIKREFDAGSDVVFRMQWYKADGTLADADAAHYVTLAGMQQDGDKKCLQVANPWGDSHHEVTDENRKDAYEKLDVTETANGLRVDNTKLETEAAGIEGAAYLCITDMYSIRKVGTGNNDLLPGGVRFLGAAQDAVGGTTLYQYQVTNEETTPIDALALWIAVPYESVSAPPNWTWTAMPTLYPHTSGCGDRMGPSGILWTTEDAPIPPGGTLGIFSFRASSAYPTGDEALDWFTDTEGGAGEVGLVFGPAPLDCPADLDGDLDVGFGDLLQLLSAWGPCAACAADLDGDDAVTFSDLLVLLASWGPCV